MSASIRWRYVPQSHQSLNVAAPSSFLAAMERAFGGPPPWTITGEHGALLRGLAAGYGGMNRDNPYQQILEHLFDNEGQSHALEIWPEY